MNDTQYEEEMSEVIQTWNNLMVKESNGYPSTLDESKVKLALSELIRARSFFLSQLFYAEGDKIRDRNLNEPSGIDGGVEKTDQHLEESP